MISQNGEHKKDMISTASVTVEVFEELNDVLSSRIGR